MNLLRSRQEQYETLEETSQSNYEERLIDFLRKEFPEANDIPSQEMKDIVHQQCKAAYAYGLNTETNTAVYLTCAWVLGTDFNHEFPAARNTLTDNDLTPNDKAKWLNEWTSEMLEKLGDE